MFPPSVMAITSTAVAATAPMTSRRVRGPNGITLSRKSIRARPAPRKITIVRTEFTPVNQAGRSFATCPRMDTMPRQPMASARYIRLLPRVASQSRTVSAAITVNATVLAIPR